MTYILHDLYASSKPLLNLPDDVVLNHISQQIIISAIFSRLYTGETLTSVEDVRRHLASSIDVDLL